MTLVSAHEVPPLLRRGHVEGLYRPPHRPFVYYLASLFRPHNELVNVWTHLAPLLWLLVYYAWPEAVADEPCWPMRTLLFGLVALFAGSSFAHLFHSQSCLHHIFWFVIDFAGIALFALCVGLQRWACEEQSTVLFDWFFVPGLVVATLGGQYGMSSYLFVTRPHWKGRQPLRIGACLCIALWLYLPLTGRYLSVPDSGDSPNGAHQDQDEVLHLHSRAFHWLLLSGVFMGAAIPERFSPGTFDLCGYGHQIFHACVVMVAWNVCEAGRADCRRWPRGNRVTEWRNVVSIGVVLASLVFIVCTLLRLLGVAKKNKHTYYSINSGGEKTASFVVRNGVVNEQEDENGLGLMTNGSGQGESERNGRRNGRKEHGE